MGWYNDSRRLRGVLKYFRDERKFRLDTSSLVEAAYHGDLYRVRLICACKFVERTADAADIAAVRGDLQMLNMLFKRGSVGSRCSTRALDGAAEEGYLAIVKYLHERGIPCTRRALDLSVRNGHVEVVHYILQHCRDVCSSYALYWATVMGRVDVVKCLVSHQVAGDLDKCIQVATQHKKNDIVNVLEAYRAKHGQIYCKQRPSRHLLGTDELPVHQFVFFILRVTQCSTKSDEVLDC